MDHTSGCTLSLGWAAYKKCDGHMAVMTGGVRERERKVDGDVGGS